MLLWWQLARWPAELSIHLYERLPRPDRATSLRGHWRSPMKWVTREQIRVNRTATCWLVRRFLDPEAEFIFVPADQVACMQFQPTAPALDAPARASPRRRSCALPPCRACSWGP